MALKKEKKTTKINLPIQNHFINRFKEVLPSGVGLAEEMADLLQVSTDSAYRRIRGETELTIEEVYKISKKYALSIDDVFSNQNACTCGSKISSIFPRLPSISDQSFKSKLKCTNIEVDSNKFFPDKKETKSLNPSL